MSNEQKVYEIIPGKKVSFPDKTKIKHTLKLKELGIDFKDSEKVNITRLTMIQDPDILLGVYNCIFDQNEKLENLQESDGIEIREALDDFLAQKCGVFFKEMKN